MRYLATVAIWGPETGFELVLDACPDDVFSAVRERVERRMEASLPGASVTRVCVERAPRVHAGETRAGYRLAVTISLSQPPGPPAGHDLNWLACWIESEVAVALLELINPMSVDGVSVTPVAGGVMETG